MALDPNTKDTLFGTAKTVSAEKKETAQQQKKELGPANPLRGTRGNFVTVGITMPPDLLCELRRVCAERRAKGLRDSDTSAVAREAIHDYLKRRRS